MVERALSTSPSLDVSVDVDDGDVDGDADADGGGSSVDLFVCDLPREAVLGVVLPTVVEGRGRRDDALAVTMGAG